MSHSAPLCAPTQGPLDLIFQRLIGFIGVADNLSVILEDHDYRVNGEKARPANPLQSALPEDMKRPDGALPLIFDALDQLDAALLRLNATVENNTNLA